jgi:hypothetical protein
VWRAAARSTTRGAGSAQAALLLPGGAWELRQGFGAGAARACSGAPPGHVDQGPGLRGADAVGERHACRGAPEQVGLAVDAIRRLADRALVSHDVVACGRQVIPARAVPGIGMVEPYQTRRVRHAGQRQACGGTRQGSPPGWGYARAAWAAWGMAGMGAGRGSTAAAGLQVGTHWDWSPAPGSRPAAAPRARPGIAAVRVADSVLIFAMISCSRSWLSASGHRDGAPCEPERANHLR